MIYDTSHPEAHRRLAVVAVFLAYRTYSLIVHIGCVFIRILFSLSHQCLPTISVRGVFTLSALLHCIAGANERLEFTDSWTVCWIC